MTVSLNMNGVNQIEKGSLIYQKDEPLQSVCLVLKGRVLVTTNGIKTVFSSGNFLGVCDIPRGVHSFSYTAHDNVVLYAFAINSIDDMWKILSQKQEYRGLLNTSLNYFIAELTRTKERLDEACKNLKEFVLAQYVYYQNTARENGITADGISSVVSFEKKSLGGILLCKDIDYYVACSTMSIEAQKNYYVGNEMVSKRHFDEQVECVFSLLMACHILAEHMLWGFRLLILDEKNLFNVIARLALDVGNLGAKNTEILAVVDLIVDKINETETFLVQKAGQEINLDRDKMEKIYFAILSGEQYEEKIQVTEERGRSDLANSLAQIVDYATVDQDMKDQFIGFIQGFISLPDQLATADAVSTLRKGIATIFYDIYESVLIKCFGDPNPPIVVKLFLNFGYVSEDLVSEDFLESLLSYTEKKTTEGMGVYTMYQWLRAIYDLEKDPSKNEYDEDYITYLRGQQRAGKITSEEEAVLAVSPTERVHFEVQNLYRYANRLVNGKISTFVPILSESLFFSNPQKSYLTAEHISSALNKMQNIDYTIFYREKVVSYEEVGIAKEVVMEKHTPDVILFPMYGQRSVMWQEMLGKKRNSKGRFLFPIFLESNLLLEVMKVLGYFRWEMCKSEQGMHWNNLHYPSLTSEYTDYLQFYRRNTDLSADGRERVRAQLQSCNSRHKEVFAKDYIDWMTRESMGNLRVNKVVRNILFTYCPFSSEIRLKLLEQVPFAEASKRYRREFVKRAKELENCCNRFIREGKEVPNELLDTMNYYKDA